MSHVIDTDGIREKLFVLEHACYGSYTYCSSRGIGGGEDSGFDGLNEYWGWMKAIVSTYTIESAVKLRMIDDYCRQNYSEEYHEIARATEVARIGAVCLGDFNLTLRESFNKIIHATRTDLSIVDGTADSGSAMRFWSGRYNLHGAKRNVEWHVQLYVAQWCAATLAFLDEVEMGEMLIDMGQDWA